MLKNIFKTNGIFKLFTSNFSTTTRCLKADDRKELINSTPRKDQGTEGESSMDIDQIISKGQFQLFPDETTPLTLFGGVPFQDIPIVNIRVTKNNTILSLTNSKGDIQVIRSCGIEGFKNARKGTNIAAQATAISFCGKIVDRGIKQARITVRGLGPGRMSAIKGLQMGGLNIISITDMTRVSWNPPRGRKQRKL